MLLYPFHLCENNSRHFFGDWDFVTQYARFHNVANEPILVSVLLQTIAQFEVQNIRDTPTAGT